MKKTLSITLANGKTFTRTTERNYTHVLVARQNEAKQHTYAHGWTAAEEKSHLEYVAHLQERADGSWWPKNGFEFRENDKAGQARDAAELAKGSDAIREEAKQSKIAAFEKRKAEGVFDLHVISWHGSEKAARSAQTTARNRGFHLDVAVVSIATQQGFPRPAVIAPDATADEVSVALFGTR